MSDINSQLANLIVDSVDAGIVVLGKKGKVELLNDSARQILGLGEKNITQFMDLGFFDDAQNEEFKDVIIQNIMEKQILKNTTCTLQICEKKKFLSISTSFLKGDTSDLFLVVLNDMTDVYELQNMKLAYDKIQKLNKELEEAKKEADFANQEKSMFLSNMSHEIRTPINAILGMNEMIMREYDEPELMEYASNIQASGKTLLYLINDILDFSKIESGKMDIISVEYQISDVLRELYQMTFFRATQKDLALNFEVDGNLPKQLIGDEVRVKQIITNILTNAVKYTKEGSVTLKASFEQKNDTVGNLIISVIDTGIGIKKEDMKGLFEKFRRLDQKKNRNIEGTGLGMSITVSLLELMEGKLEVESEYQKGSTFRVIIPQKRVGEDTIGSFEGILHDVAVSKTKYRSFLAPEARILVVDDNPMNLKVIQGLLKCTKIQLTLAQSGKECLELLERQDFDLLLLDHMMPEMDGIETLHHIKRMTKTGIDKLPIIVLTANAVSGSKEMYLEEGFTDFLSKPIDSRLLEKMLMEYLPEELIQEGKDETVKGATNKGKIPLGDEELKNIKDIYDIDVKSAIGHVDQDFDFYLELLQQFNRQYEKRIKDLHMFAGEKNYKQYGILAHAIKGDVRLLGAEKLGAIAYDHEMAGKSENVNYIEDNLEEFIKQISFAVEGFQNILVRQHKFKVEQEEIEKNAIPLEELMQKIELVIQKLDDFEDEQGVDILIQLLDFSMDEQLKNKLEQALVAVKQEYDGDKAVEILKELLNGGNEEC